MCFHFIRSRSLLLLHCSNILWWCPAGVCSGPSDDELSLNQQVWLQPVHVHLCASGKSPSFLHCFRQEVKTFFANRGATHAFLRILTGSLGLSVVWDCFTRTGDGRTKTRRTCQGGFMLKSFNNETFSIFASNVLHRKRVEEYIVKHSYPSVDFDRSTLCSDTVESIWQTVTTSGYIFV